MRQWHPNERVIVVRRLSFLARVDFDGLAEEHEEVRQEDLVEKVHDALVRDKVVENGVLPGETHDSYRFGSFEPVPSEPLVHAADDLFDLLDGLRVEDLKATRRRHEPARPEPEN